MTDRTYAVVRLDDEDVARLVLDSADAVGRGNWGLYRVSLMARAVAFGRKMGAKVGLEPLDDAMRCAVDDELIQLIHQHDPGRRGWIDTLNRLRSFLDRYPERGRPDDGGPGLAPRPAFPEVDVTITPHTLEQRVALARLVLDKYAKGGGALTQGDAERISATMQAWWDHGGLLGNAGPNDAAGPQGGAA